jgi:hypothetical protein
MPERDCDLLRDLLISERVETVVEVGQPDTKCLNRVSQLRPSFMQRDRRNSNPTL